MRARPLPALAGVVLLGTAVTVGLTPAAGAADVACTVTYKVGSEWNTGFGATVDVRNEGTDPIADWNLTWTFADGQQITQLWNGTHTQTGAAVSVRGANWNSSLGAGVTTQVGFNASKSAQNRVPADFAVNGTACTGANKAPGVQLTKPAPNSSYAVPAQIPLEASASDTDGTVQKVEFYAGTQLLGTDTSAPFQHDWAGAAPGEYSVTAKAFDNKGATSLSSPVAVKVLAAPAVVTTPSTVNVKQGESTTVDVKLAVQPSGPVTVTVARTAGSADLTASPATLSFTTANWNTGQPVTISSAANGGALATASFSLTAPGLTAAPIEVTELDPSASDYQAAFLEQYNKIKDADSGYFRNFGGLLVPYHSVETLLVEAPDHGHQTTSEAFSYYLWLEAAYGQLQGDWAPFNAAGPRWRSTSSRRRPTSRRTTSTTRRNRRPTRRSTRGWTSTRRSWRAPSRSAPTRSRPS